MCVARYLLSQRVLVSSRSFSPHATCEYPRPCLPHSRYVSRTTWRTRETRSPRLQFFFFFLPLLLLLPISRPREPSRRAKTAAPWAPVRARIRRQSAAINASTKSRHRGVSASLLLFFSFLPFGGVLPFFPHCSPLPVTVRSPSPFPPPLLPPPPSSSSCCCPVGNVEIRWEHLAERHLPSRLVRV